MNKIFLLIPLKNKIPKSILIFSIFLVSGLLHEMGISYPDGLSWGYPLLYFVIQGLGMQIELRKNFPRSIIWLWIILPVPLLFTPSFTNLFLGNLLQILAKIIFTLTSKDFLFYGLLFGGFAQLLVLCASIQVPGKLGWREQFQKLNSLNRKIFWTYGGYILSIIIFMSVVSFILCRSDLQNIPISASMWLIFIALFWWARVLTDFFYMKHTDWPQGPLFTIGHICLTTLFITLALLYTALSLISFGVIL